MTDYQLYSDSQLVPLIKQGNTNAYTEIYDRYFGLMLSFALKKLGDEELAKDCVQELFVKLWEQRSRFSINENFSAYLYVTMRNRIFSYFQHQKVEDKYVDFLKNYEFASCSTEADYEVREKQLADYIELQIQALPKKMRRMFEMSRKEYLSHREIAIVLQTSENNVKTQIMNAKRILKKKLRTILLP